MELAERSVLIVVPFAFHRESGSSLSTYYRVLAISELVGSVDIVTTPHGKDIQSTKIRIFRTPGKQFFSSYQPGEYKKRLIYEFFLFLKTIMMMIRGNYSIVIIHGSSIYWAFWLQIFFRAPFIATVHGNIQFELEKWNISSGKFWKKLATRIENRIIRSFHHIIAEHEFVEEILEKSGISPAKISLIGIAVKGVPRIEKQTPSDEFNILYTGTFVKIQNLNLLFSMMNLLRGKRVKLVLIGGIDREIKEARSQAENMKLSDSIEIIPRLDQKDLIEYYRLADIVVSPREFGFDTPMKIFDYLNYGKCILATDRPIHTGILNHTVACLAEPTPEAFAEKICQLKNNNISVIQKGKSAKKYFEEKFDFMTMIKNYKYLFDKHVL
jgi:glycosyltransferase involved in cell wall biosynthesis